MFGGAFEGFGGFVGGFGVGGGPDGCLFKLC